MAELIASGAPDLPTPQSYGTAKSTHNTAGAPALPALMAAGTASLRPAVLASGALTLPALSIRGAVPRRRAVSFPYRFIAVADSGEIAVSQDGANWSANGTLPYAWSVGDWRAAAISGDGHALVVGSSTTKTLGVAMSDDGDNWTVLAAPMPESWANSGGGLRLLWTDLFNAGRFYCSLGSVWGGIWYSDDNGLNWTPMAFEGLPTPPGDFVPTGRGVIAMTLGADRILCACFVGDDNANLRLFYSTDGVTMRPGATGGSSGAGPYTVPSLVYVPTRNLFSLVGRTTDPYWINQGVVGFTTVDGTVASAPFAVALPGTADDYGYTHLGAGAPGVWMPNVGQLVVPINASDGFGTQTGVYLLFLRSQDGSHYSYAPPTYTTIGYGVYGLVYSQGRAVSGQQIFNAAGGFVYTDDGLTYHAVAGPSVKNWSAVAAAPPLPNMVFVLASATTAGRKDQALRSSVNAGLAWRTVTTPNIGDTYIGGAYSPTLGETLFLGATGNIARSYDGRALEAVTNNIGTGPWRDILWVESSALYIACGQDAAGYGIKTSPDGETWTARYTGAQPWEVLFFDTKHNFVLCGSSTVSNAPLLFSADGGRNWQGLGASFSYSGTDIAQTQAGRLWFASQAMVRPVYTDDLGTFTQAPSVGEGVSAIAYNPQTDLINVAGASGIWSSPSSGTLAWTLRASALPFQDADDLIWLEDDATEMAIRRVTGAETEVRVLKSADGTAWTASAGLPLVAWTKLVEAKSVTPPPTAAGTPQVPRLTASGAAHSTRRASGALMLAALIANGAATMIEAGVGAGAATLAPLTVTGSAQLGGAFGQGAASLAPLSLTGTAMVAAQAAGASSLPPLLVTASAYRQTPAEGVGTLAPVSGGGAATLARNGAGASPLAPLTVAGSAQRTVLGAGLAALAPLTGHGTARKGGDVTADLLLGPNGGAAVARKPTGAPDLALPVADGVAYRMIVSDGASALLPLTASATTILARNGAGAATLVPPGATGAADRVLLANGVATLALLATDATAMVTRPAAGASTLPLVVGTGEATIAAQMSGAPSLPLVLITASAQRGLGATGANTLAALSGFGVATVARNAHGALTLLAPTASGAAMVAAQASGALTLRIPFAAGTAGRAISASGVALLAPLTSAASVSLRSFAAGAPSLPGLTSDGAVIAYDIAKNILVADALVIEPAMTAATVTLSPTLVGEVSIDAALSAAPRVEPL